MLAAGAGMAVAAAGGVALLRDRSNRQRLKDALARWAPPTVNLDDHAPTGALTEAEMATVVSLAEVIYPPDTNADVGAFTRAHVVRRCAEDAGYLPLYQSGVRLLDQTAAASQGGKRFAELPRDARDEVLRSLLWSYSGRRFIGYAGRTLEELTADPQALALRRFVMTDLLQAYYRSGYGWAVVGYTHYPGVPAADPRDYTRPVGS